MEGEGHLLSNHVDIEAGMNNTIEHFLYEESFCGEPKICLNLVRRGQDIFTILQQALGDLHFSTLSMNNDCNQKKVGESISLIIIIAPLVAIIKPSSSNLE